MASPPPCTTISEHFPSSSSPHNQVELEDFVNLRGIECLHSSQPHLQNSAPNLVADDGRSLHNFDHYLSDSTYCNFVTSMEKHTQVVNVGESHHQKSNDVVEPCKDMTFKSLDEVNQFYYAYARVQGFNVRIRNSACFPRSKEIRYRRYVCSCEGSCLEKESMIDVQKEKKTLTIRKSCPVQLTVSRKSSTSDWVVINIENVHNHVLVSPRSVKNLRNQKAMPTIVKNLVERFSEAGLPTGRVADILSDEPLVNISSRDCWNHMRNLRTRNLDVGDAESVFQYCKMKQAQDPNFYYSILPDKESRMVNFFWIDSRARLYYERFGDVVVFDTTYKTNKYGMPFGLFVGGNHHYKSILFGCALLQDESEESFVWLFETWLDSIHGKAPISILTDQDRAIGNAIKRVFPHTTHRLCLWHIMKKFPEKYENLYKKKSPFKKDMKKCLHQSITAKDFEEEWLAIMKRYISHCTCECHLFEFKGILCRHILAIFQRKDVQKIHAKYILPRWTKEAADDIPIPIAKETDKSSIIRTMHFHRQVNLLLPYVHDSVEAYQIITDAMKATYEMVSQMKELNKEVGEVEVAQLENEPVDRQLGDPHISKTKGRSKSSQNESKNGRFKGGFEIGMNQTSKKKRKCSTCHEIGHNSSTCKKI